MTIRDLARRSIAAAERVRSKRSHPAVYALAIAFFTFFGVLALRTFPSEEVESPQLWPALALLLLAVPINVFVNSIEYRIQARLVGVASSARHALKVSILATASNMLPIPGSVLVRTSSLIEHVGAKQASASSAAVGMVWLGMSLLPAGLALTTSSAPAGAVAGGVGAATLTAGFILVSRLTSEWRTVLPRLVAIEFVTVIVAGTRFWLALRAIGFRAELDQLVPFAMAGALASATGFLPAGIGVREAVASGIAAIVDVPPSIGYVAAASDTIATVIVIAVLAAVVVISPSLRRPRRSASDR